MCSGRAQPVELSAKSSTAIESTFRRLSMPWRKCVGRFRDMVFGRAAPRSSSLSLFFRNWVAPSRLDLARAHEGLVAPSPSRPATSSHFLRSTRPPTLRGRGGKEARGFPAMVGSQCTQELVSQASGLSFATRRHWAPHASLAPADRLESLKTWFFSHFAMPAVIPLDVLPRSEHPRVTTAPRGSCGP